MSRPFAVIGAGAVGLACAYHLRRAGLDVEVFDRAEPGSGASSGNAGWIVPALSAPLPGPGALSQALRSVGNPSSPLRIDPASLPGLATWLIAFARRCNSRDQLAGLHATARLAEPSLRLYDDLQSDGVSFDMRSSGLLFAFRSEAAARAEARALAPLREHGICFQELSAGAATDLEPALGPDVRGGVFVDSERHVDPSSLVTGLVAKLEQMDVPVHCGAEIGGFDASAGRVTGLRGVGEVSGILIAAGAWSASLAARLGARLPVRPAWGCSFTVDVQPRPSRPLYLGESYVGCTPLNGHVRLAGTLELGGPGRPRRRKVEAMMAAARRYLVGVDGGTPRDVWTGPRPLTPDGIPVLGRLPGWDNAYVATGHSMLGITLAPATGAAMADLITGATSEVLNPFDPARFR